ncbi:hypothetical protein [Cupriavidus necator]
MTAHSLPNDDLSVDQLRDALQRLSEAGHGRLPVHALAEGLTGPVRSVELVRAWQPGVGAVALLSVDADAASDLLDLARQVEQLLANQGWRDTGHDPESRLLQAARASLAKYG